MNVYQMIRHEYGSDDGSPYHQPAEIEPFAAEIAVLRARSAALEAKLQALHDEFAAEARAYGNYEDDEFVSGMIAGRQEKAEDVRDRLAEILKEFA